MRIARARELKRLYGIESCSSNGEQRALNWSWAGVTSERNFFRLTEIFVLAQGRFRQLCRGSFKIVKTLSVLAGTTRRLASFS
jgi:hypothetical protein